MWKLFIAFVVALGLGIAVGWLLREDKAVKDCVGAEGKWLPGAGHCSGSRYGEMQP
jgi:hypothetical protein